MRASWPVVAALGLIVAVPQIAAADTYTMATFSGAISGGTANVKPPFRGNGFTPGDSISGGFVFDNNLVPASGSGFVNVPFLNYPDIALIPPGTAFNLTLDGLHFTLADNVDSLGHAAVQYNNGNFNGFFFVSDFAFQGNEYQLRIQGNAMSVLALDASGNPTSFSSLINSRLNIGDTNLTDEAAFTPGQDIGAVGAPGPVAGAGLPGLLAGFGAVLAWYRKRRAAV